MPEIATETEIARFFDSFVEAFATFDGHALGRLFVTPGVALRRDGSLRGFSVQQDVEDYYQAALDRYRAQGCCTCRYSNLVTQVLNDRSAIATARWELLLSDGSAMSSWRQAYFVSRFAGQWRIYGSAYISE